MHIKIDSVIAVLFGLYVVTASPAQAASFNCEKAGTKIEKMICSSESISALDGKLQDEVYKSSRTGML